MQWFALTGRRRVDAGEFRTHIGHHRRLGPKDPHQFIVTAGSPHCAGDEPLPADRECGRTMLVPDPREGEHAAYQGTGLVDGAMVGSVGGIQRTAAPAVGLVDGTQPCGGDLIGPGAIGSDEPCGKVCRLEGQNIWNEALAAGAAAKGARDAGSLDKFIDGHVGPSIQICKRFEPFGQQRCGYDAWNVHVCNPIIEEATVRSAGRLGQDNRVARAFAA